MRKHQSVRTTLDIDDDVLAAAREIARRERRTAGAVVSDLARRALTGTATPNPTVRESPALYGFEPFPADGRIVTNELIDRLREHDDD